MRKELIAGGAIAAAALTLAGPALAQSTVIDGGAIFGAWRPYIVEMAGIIIFGILGWGFRLVQAKTGMDIDARYRETIQTAVTNAAGKLIASAGGAAEALKIDVKSEALAGAVNYVLTGAPDALARFGVTPERVREMVVAKVGVLAAPATAPAPTTPSA